MAREQLLGLASDVDRLLAAGASATGGNENLRKRGKALRDLSRKTAVLKPVADLVDRVLEAPAEQVGKSFLDLLTMTRQLRGNLCSAGSEGTLTPVPVCGPWATALPLGDLRSLDEALALSRPDWEDILKDASHRNAIADLRLVSTVLGTLGEGYDWFSDRVVREVLPAFGPGIVPEVESRLRIAGGKLGDARRLQLIGRLHPARALELCRVAIKEGSLALRVKALEMLPELCDREEAEAIGLEMSRDARSEVRVAAVLTLRKASSDEALDALLTAAGDCSTPVRGAVGTTLSEFTNPRTTPRLLTLLEQTLHQLDWLPLERTEKKTRTRKTAGKKPAMSSRKDANQEKRGQLTETACCLLEVLGRRKEDGREEVVRILLSLVDHQEVSIRDAARTALASVLKGLPPELREPVIPTVLNLLERPELNDRLLGSLLTLLPEHADRHRPRILAILHAVMLRKSSGLRTSDLYHSAMVILNKMGAVGGGVGAEHQRGARRELPARLPHRFRWSGWQV